jgi:lipopolysaccharide export system protein LptC
MNLARLWRRGADQVSAWLPALLMLLFALGTWWLVRNAPKLAGAEPPPPVSQSPDYFVRDFSVRSFDPAGRLKSELTGQEGRHYAATDTLQVDNPRVRTYDDGGHPTVTTARQGQSNHDGSEIKLFGDAHVTRDPVTQPDGKMAPRMEFKGEFLEIWVDKKQVRSDQPVQLMRGPDWFSADSLEYDDNTRVGWLRGHVRGVIQPTPAAGALRR